MTPEALQAALEYARGMNEDDPEAWITLIKMVWGEEALQTLDALTQERFGLSFSEYLKGILGIGLKPALYWVFPAGLQLELPLLPPLRAGVLPTPPVTALIKIRGGRQYALGLTLPVPGFQVLIDRAGFQTTILSELPIIPHSRIP